ncbi:Sugar kinase OS=Streptomyces glaucescens OX=1907 GN=SGLAU_15465 PE=3 SV=1 [Streptomyces glaucescens]
MFPPGVPAGVRLHWCAPPARPTPLDTSGEPLRRAVAARPQANTDGGRARRAHEPLRATRRLPCRGVASLGRDGLR